jgi:transcriptional regulator with XRE-family HTH domain
MGTNRGTKPEVKEDDRKVLGNRLREAREYLGFSQEEVANYLKVPRTALTSIEAGTRKVDALELKKLASLYKRPVAHFTGEGVEEQFGDEDVAHLARKARELSPEDRAELGRFADFLRAKKQARGG